jgi:hypothetical protein
MGYYLSQEQLIGNLRLGKSAEQWLSYVAINDFFVLKWLSIDREKTGGYSIAYFEVFDEGDSGFVDIYEFSTVEPDDIGGVINSFSTVDEALQFTVVNYSASLSKFVSAGMIQEEYLKYLGSKSDK